MKKAHLPPMTNDGQDASDPPAFPFWQMENGTDGQSTIALSLLDGFLQRIVSGPTDPIWMREFHGRVGKIWFNILPVGWIGEWHPSPSLQWVVPLSGRWFIETQSGTRVEMGPGDIHWGADVQSDKSGTEIGHRSGQIGDVPCVHMMVQFTEVADTGVAAPTR